LGLVVSTVDRAHVEAMFLLRETAEMPAQQVRITALPCDCPNIYPVVQLCSPLHLSKIESTLCLMLQRVLPV